MSTPHSNDPDSVSAPAGRGDDEVGEKRPDADEAGLAVPGLAAPETSSGEGDDEEIFRFSTVPPATTARDALASAQATTKAALASAASWSHGQLDGLRDRERPIPPAVRLALAVLVTAITLLTLRLLTVDRTASPSTPSAVVSAPQPAPPMATTLAPIPPSSDEAFEAFVRSWRTAWQAKDLADYLSHYARIFGGQGKDFGTWSEHKATVFASDGAIEIETSDLQVKQNGAIAIVEFIQVYRSGDYRDRGRKRLYLVPEDGQWKIFNEEWEPLE